MATQKSSIFALNKANNFDMSSEEKSGCFTWCIRLKKACNQRWARVVNRLRRRIQSRRGNKVEPEKVLDETGAGDIVLTKSFGTKQDKTVTKETVAGSGNGWEDDTTDFDRKVGNYVANILSAAVDTLNSEEQLPSNNNIININADDNISMTSSVISQIADIAVSESLSTVAMDIDTNQSARGDKRSSTLSNFIDELAENI